MGVQVVLKEGWSLISVVVPVLSQPGWEKSVLLTSESAHKLRTASSRETEPESVPSAEKQQVLQTWVKQALSCMAMQQCSSWPPLCRALKLAGRLAWRQWLGMEWWWLCWCISSNSGFLSGWLSDCDGVLHFPWQVSCSPPRVWPLALPNPASRLSSCPEQSGPQHGSSASWRTNQ